MSSRIPATVLSSLNPWVRNAAASSATPACGESPGSPRIPALTEPGALEWLGGLSEQLANTFISSRNLIEMVRRVSWYATMHNQP